MDLAQNLKIIMDTWPTSPKNLQHNCLLFENLNPEGLLVDRLDENSDYYKFCVDYSYATMGLKQRGLMNMTYYLLLDQFINTSKKGQHGGVKLETLVKNIIVSFSLLGTSANLEVSTTEQGHVSLLQDTRSPVGNVKDIETYRMRTADLALQTLIKNEPWVFSEQDIVIATGLSPTQIDYFVDAMNDLNAQLASLSKDARNACVEIVSASEDKGVFTESEFYKSVVNEVKKQEDLLTEKRTVDTIQDGLAALTNTALYATTSGVYGALGVRSNDRTIDPKEVIERAYDTVVRSRNLNLVGQVETFAYSMQYQKLCKATPNPRFIVDVDKTTIKMKTHFGNADTGALLMYHMATIQKIDEKLLTIKDPIESKALTSLKERIMMQKKIIESSSLFSPLEGIPGISNLRETILDSHSSTRHFELLVNKLSEVFPISDEDFRNNALIKKQMTEQKSAQRKQVLQEWALLAKDVGAGATTILTDAVGNVADATTKIIDHAGDVLDTGINNVEKIGVKTVNAAGTILEAGVDQTLDSFWKIFPTLVTIVGFMGAIAVFFVWFKRAMIRGGKRKRTHKRGKRSKRTKKYRNYKQ